MTPRLQRVLVVEDDPSIQAIAKISLEMVGQLTALVCASGAEAVARGPVFAPDLVLLDARMPGLDGPATMAALRAIPSVAQVPVVFLTAASSADESKRLLALGAAAVLPKAFDPRTLPGKLLGIWERLHG